MTFFHTTSCTIYVFYSEYVVVVEEKVNFMHTHTHIFNATAHVGLLVAEHTFGTYLVLYVKMLSMLQ